LGREFGSVIDGADAEHQRHRRCEQGSRHDGSRAFCRRDQEKA
jgi:hypothetical protein